jgi:hypothetical protein
MSVTIISTMTLYRKYGNHQPSLSEWVQIGRIAIVHSVVLLTTLLHFSHILVALSTKRRIFPLPIATVLVLSSVVDVVLVSTLVSTTAAICTSTYSSVKYRQQQQQKWLKSSRYLSSFFFNEEKHKNVDFSSTNYHIVMPCNLYHAYIMGTSLHPKITQTPAIFLEGNTKINEKLIKAITKTDI